jgi:hypothetical protein
MSKGLFARRPLRRMLRHWLERHRHPFNFWIHLLGIPLAVAGVALLFTLPWEQWYVGAGAFILGYLLQYIGHRVEGNDVGEWAGIKKLLGLPYVSIAPRWQDRPKAQETQSVEPRTE